MTNNEQRAAQHLESLLAVWDTGTDEAKRDAVEVALSRLVMYSRQQKGSDVVSATKPTNYEYPMWHGPRTIKLSSGEVISRYDYHQHTSDTGTCTCCYCEDTRRAAAIGILIRRGDPTQELPR